MTGLAGTQVAWRAGTLRSRGDLARYLVGLLVVAGGWGLQLIEGLMDSVDVQRSTDGTVVQMRRRLATGRPG
jgi:anti-sigma regulatory factor (Ser/Thr protein kinase)